MPFSIAGRTALVTGANRGMGRHHVDQLLARGASKVYAGVRRPEDVDIPGAEVIRIDITNVASVEAAARVAGDVDLLINNAGISTFTNLVIGDVDKIRLEMETHFFGTLNVVRAFAPVLASNGGGAILNILSALSWFSYDGVNAYAAAKSAEWSLTNGIRLELAGQGTQVSGLHVGAVATELMGDDYRGPMEDPEEVVRVALDGVEAGADEIVVDDWSRMVKASLASDPGAFYAQIAQLA